MNYGSTLQIMLTDRTGKNPFYTEPFTIDKWNTHNKFEEALSIFSENASDAIKSILQDIETDSKLKDLSDEALAGALRNRGYTVTKHAAS